MWGDKTAALMGLVFKRLSKNASRPGWFPYLSRCLSKPARPLLCTLRVPQALYKGATRVILATENDYCKLCDASFSSLAVAQAHYQGKNHAKKLRLAEAQQNSANK